MNEPDIAQTHPSDSRNMNPGALLALRDAEAERDRKKADPGRPHALQWALAIVLGTIILAAAFGGYTYMAYYN